MSRAIKKIDLLVLVRQQVDALQQLFYAAVACWFAFERRKVGEGLPDGKLLGTPLPLQPRL